MSTPSPAISIRGVSKSFGPKVAVKNLDLTVAQGALCGFIGPNGAGKTTTIRMIMSIIFPDSGEISVLGKASAVESKDRIGYLPEERGVYRKMKVGAFLNYMARLKGIHLGASDRKVRAWLEKVGLAENYRKKCEELSKGMQQKVQFIAAVIHEPDLLILDEVFTGLDPLNRRLMRDLIDEQHRAGRTIIFSTHAMFEAEQLCDQIFMIHQGVKMLDGTLREIVAKFDPKSLLVQPESPDDAGGLARIPGVTVLDVPDSRPGHLTIEVRISDALSRAEGMRRIVDAIPLRRIEVKRVTLEDVFIEMVRKTGGEPVNLAQIREEAALAAARASGGLS